MDRVSVRSFRAADLAERGVKDLARSRLDTTREVEFQPLGARFFEAREDLARTTTLFREDGFHAPEGHFTRMTLRVEPQLAERLAALDPRAVEARLAEAARNAILRQWPRAQGVYVARFEPSDRAGLEPVIHAHLSSRRTDGGPAPAVTREEARHFEGTWSREVDGALGPVRQLAEERDRVLGPEAKRTREEWARSSSRLFAVYSERLAGKASREDLLDAVRQARGARAAWNREVGPPVDVRDVERRQVFDVVRLRIGGGSRFLSGPLEAHRRDLLETAASRAAGLPDGPDRRLAVVAWPAGRDLQATVYFNQRSQPGRAENGIEPERLRALLEERLRGEIQRVAPSLDPTAQARAAELGRIEARLPERAPRPERAVPAPARQVATERDAASGAIVIHLDRGVDREGATVPGRERGSAQSPLDQLRPQERDWSNERVFSVRLRIPTGAHEIESRGLGADETARVIQRAVDRAYPFLEREGLRNNFLYSARGRALDVQVVIPEKLGWSPGQLRSPQFQQRFMAGFHHALGQVAPSRLSPDRAPVMPGLVRGAVAAREAPQVLRRAERDPERAAKDLSRAVFSKLSEALPKPFRLMRDLGRTLSRFVPRG